MTLTWTATRRMKLSLLPAVLGAVILGILGMHALAHHEPSTVDAGHESAAVASTGHRVMGAEAHSDQATALHASMTSPESAAASALSVRGTGHATGEMVMLCAAMLIGAAAGALVMWCLRRITHAAGPGFQPASAAVRRLHALPLPTGPPAVWQFSVIRC